VVVDVGAAEGRIERASDRKNLVADDFGLGAARNPAP
jgi:hypothetical protein